MKEGLIRVCKYIYSKTLELDPRMLDGPGLLGRYIRFVVPRDPVLGNYVNLNVVASVMM